MPSVQTRGEDDPLQAQLAVLDLGDVLELGGQPGHPAQRGPLLAVELLSVVSQLVVLETVRLVCVGLGGEGLGPLGEQF